MKSFKRISALVVALILTLTLVSCGGDETSKNDASTVSKAEVSTSDKSEATSEVTSETASEDVSADISEDASTDESGAVSEDNSIEEVESDAVAVYGTPKLDASDIDTLWDSAPKYTGEKIRSISTKSDTYTRFTFQLMWDETHLYVLEKVTDLSIGGFDPNLTYQNDSTEICISLLANKSNKLDLAHDGWFGISPDEMTYCDDRALLLGGKSLDHVQYTTDYDDTGYVVCVAFDIASMASDVDWKEGHMIGFEISVNDSVVSGDREMCIGWADDTDGASENPSVYGSVKLVKSAN